MNIEQSLKALVAQAAQDLYQFELPSDQVQINTTPAEFQGHFTVVAFPLVKAAKKKPEEVAQDLGTYLQAQSPLVEAFNIVKGFCNLVIADVYWKELLGQVLQTDFGQAPSKGQTVVVEYSSPNTNKPLHLGHVRNNLLGYAMSQVLQAAGYAVKKVQIINDRGIHICKSMLAWQRFGQGETPQSSGLKGDHLVGKYYVEFEKRFQEEYKAWQLSPQGQERLSQWLADEKNVQKAQKELDKQLKKAEEKAETPINPEYFSLSKYFFKEIYKNTYFNEDSHLGKACKQMLQDWEQGQAEVVQLWEQMNGWVYQGFEQTYQQLGVKFDKLYYESNTYLKGKQLVEDSLQAPNSIFYREADGSVWIDLSSVKLDKKAVLRNDGTSMYITQDLGTALLRFEDFDMDQMIYVVGNEQEYHFQVLFEILKRLGYKFANNCHHLSYGMVNLTTGKMKSREGTVVDADDLIQKIVEAVAEESKERNTLDGLSAEEQQQTWHNIALSALKFFILKVEAKKTMIFDPKQSIDLQGQTGPYILNAYVRTQAVQRKAQQQNWPQAEYSGYALKEEERQLLVLSHRFPQIVQVAAQTYNPAEIANYLYELARAYHRFWNDVVILDKQDPTGSYFRLDLSRVVAKILFKGGQLLGMDMVERM